jgi:putative membrane protein
LVEKEGMIKTMHDMDGSWWIWGSVMMVLFWGAIIALAVWAVSLLTKREHSALDIAKERYARGEITQEEFERIRDDLRKAGLGTA